MDVLWHSPGGATAQHIRSSINPSGFNISTILTVLQRLGLKDMVSRHEHGRMHHYYAQLSSVEYAGRQMVEVLAGASNKFSALEYFVQKMTDNEKIRAAK